jgi:predicted outer membrane repeat protein
MLRRMMNRLSKGKKSRSQSARRGFQNQRGRFETLEDRLMLSVNVLSSTQVGTTGFEQFEDLFAAGSGNVFATGWSTGALYGSSAGTLDAVVGKYSASGSPIWTRQFGTTDQDVGHGVVSDASGNVYVTGSTDGALQGAFLGIRDIFIRKYDSSGNHAWTKQIGTAGHDTGYDIAVDSSGNIYVAAIVSGNLGGTHYGLVDVFVAKYNSSGTVQWTTQLGTASDDYANSISVDASGNVYVGGYTKGALIGTNAGGTDAFITKLNGTGSQIWVKQFGASTNDSCESVAVDSSGNVLASGRSNGVAFISKYNSAGTQLWSNTINIPSTSNIRPYGVSLDGEDNVYVGGTVLTAFNGPVSDDAFVVKYSSAGNALWTKIVATNSDEDGLALSVNAFGIYVGGETGGSLGAPQLGNGDAFFTRIVDSSYSINTTSDTVDANPGDGVARDSFGNTSLRAAIQEANALGVPTEITVPAGTYNLTITGSGDNAGDLDITGDITIVGAGAGKTIVNASSLTNERIFDVFDTLNLSGVTLTGADVSSGVNGVVGGAIWVRSGAVLDLKDSAVVDNTADTYGGGIYSSGTLTISGSVITDNHVVNATSKGGGIYAVSGTATMGSSIVANNTADPSGDQDIYGVASVWTSLGYNLLTSVRSVLVADFSQTGDLIDNNVDYVVTSLIDEVNNTNDAYSHTLREAVISANALDGTIWLPAWKLPLTLAGSNDNSGDIDINGSGSNALADVTIRGIGPGLSVIDASNLANERIFDVFDTLNLSGVTLTGADISAGINGVVGGAIWVRSGAVLDLKDSAVVDNTADTYGGGIYSQGTLTISGSVITDNHVVNSSSQGGGIYAVSGTAAMGSSIVANNTADPSGDQDIYGVASVWTSLGYNLLTSIRSVLVADFSQTGDLISSSVDHMITSLADVINPADNGYALTLREAVILSNSTAPDETIWMAPWGVRLLIEGTGGAESGDLDISDTLAIRGISSGTDQSLVDSLSIIDSAFDNLGLLTLTNVSTS